MTDRNHTDLRQGIVDTCQEMNRNGLNQGTSGNLSHRISNGMLITPTSLPYDRMRGRPEVEGLLPSVRCCRVARAISTGPT